MSKMATFMFLNVRCTKYDSRFYKPLLFIGFCFLIQFLAIINGQHTILPILSLIIGSSMIPPLFTMFDGGRQDKLEVFYATLPLTRGDIVKNKYLLSILILMVVIFPIMLLSLWGESRYLYFIVAVIFPISVLIMSLSQSCFFKWGYSTMWFWQLIDALTVPIYRSMVANWGHRHARWIPPLVNGMVIVFFFSIVGFSIIFIIKNVEKIDVFIAAHPVIIFSLLYGGSLILFYSSYRLSCRFYEKRDL